MAAPGVVGELPEAAEAGEALATALLRVEGTTTSGGSSLDPAAMSAALTPTLMPALPSPLLCGRGGG